MMVYAFSPNTWEFKASLVYIVSSRTTRVLGMGLERWLSG